MVKFLIISSLIMIFIILIDNKLQSGIHRKKIVLRKVDNAIYEDLTKYRNLNINIDSKCLMEGLISSKYLTNINYDTLEQIPKEGYLHNHKIIDAFLRCEDYRYVGRKIILTLSDGTNRITTQPFRISTNIARQIREGRKILISFEVKNEDYESVKVRNIEVTNYCDDTFVVPDNQRIYTI